jgi:hypothetical protein
MLSKSSIWSPLAECPRELSIAFKIQTYSIRLPNQNVIHNIEIIK